LKRLNLLGGPIQVVDTPQLKMVLASIREPKTKTANEAPSSLRKKGKALMASTTHSSHVRKNHLICMLMLIMHVMFIMLLIMILVLIMLFFLCVMFIVMFILHMP
jgi:hypothetical protein